MDIHRCRFVPYPPHSINALAFSHASQPDEETPPSLRLAVGRGNGDVEIWNPNGGQWFQESILRGGKERSIEGLVWTQDFTIDSEGSGQTSPLRLFSIGDSSSITEWNLALGIPKTHVSGNAGDIWCLAAQPASSDGQSSQVLAAGCGSGEIVLFSTADNELQYFKSLPVPAVKKPKVLSICWRDRNTVVAGYDDSKIRVFDANTRSTIRTMSLGSSLEGGDSYVWCVKCLKDGTILSGDSTGGLKIWEAKELSLYQQLKTHDADILDIGTNTAGDKIFTVGVDRRTTAYHQTATGTKQGSHKWAEVMHVRFHQHDVKCIATFESKELNIMASGGVDTLLVIAPVREWMNEYHRTLTNLPHNPQLAVSKSSRLLLTWWDRELWVWRIRHPSGATASGELVHDDRRYFLAARFTLDGEESITLADISESGQFILVSTNSNVKLFQLRWSASKGQSVIRSRQIVLPASMGLFGARLVKFSPDGKWLAAIRLDDSAVLARLLEPRRNGDAPVILEKVVRLNRSPRKIQTDGKGLGSYTEAISHMTFSPDGRILIVADRSGTINVWILEGVEDGDQQPAAVTTPNVKSASEDSDSESDDESDIQVIILGQRWIRHPARHALPNLGSPILALAMRPEPCGPPAAITDGNVGLHATRHNPHPVSHHLSSMDQQLVAVTARHEIVEFDLATGKFSDWTRRNPADYLPSAFKRLRDRAMGCFFDCNSTRRRLWLYGAMWLFMLDMSQDLPTPRSADHIGAYEVRDPSETLQKKRKISDSRPRLVPPRSTGAGDKMAPRENYLGVGKRLQTFRDPHQEDSRLIEFNQSDNDLADAMGIEGHHNSLAMIRRANSDSAEQPLTNGSLALSTHTHDKPSEGKSVQQQKLPGWWHTFNYRAIFGVLPLTTWESPIESNNDYTDGMTEVMLIERPIYEVDLPERYDSRQEWDT